MHSRSVSEEELTALCRTLGERKHREQQIVIIEEFS
jgi:hypothetical protein